MAQVLLVEDSPSDARTVVDIALSVGITDVEVCSSLQQGVRRLETCLRGEAVLPSAIILDLDLGCFGNGYEVLRIRYTAPSLRKIPLIVWTRLDESARDVCELFAVNAVIFKWDGPAKLREALEEIVQHDCK